MKSAAPPLVSVIVPSYNSARTLEGTLASLGALSWSNYEVIVVDDGSTDGSPEIARRFPVRLVLLGRNSGAGVARMAGVAVARGEILAFTDSDVVVAVDWLDRGMELLEETGAVAVSGPFTGSASESFIQKFCYHFLRDREVTARSRVSTVTTSNMLVRAREFRETGAFPIYGLGRDPDRAFQGHEDSNWAYLAVRDHDAFIVWEPSFGVTHDFRDTLWDLLRQQWFIAHVEMVSYLRYPGMFKAPSNFRKGSTMTHLLVTWLGSLGAVTLIPIGFVNPLAWLGAGACTGAVLASLLSHTSFFKAIAREERSPLFLAKALGTLYLLYMARDVGIVAALAKVVAAGGRFGEIRDLPPYSVEDRGAPDGSGRSGPGDGGDSS